MSPEAEQQTDRDLTALLMGLACGTVLGVALGLLLAPARGRDTRAWIATQGRAAGRRTAEFIDRNEAIAIIRRGGVRSLLKVLRPRVQDPAAD